MITLLATRRGSWESKVHAFDTALVNLSDPKSHDFGGGVLDALISSGRLEIISDNDLRVKLATWSEVFNEILDALDSYFAEIRQTAVLALSGSDCGHDNALKSANFSATCAHFRVRHDATCP